MIWPMEVISQLPSIPQHGWRNPSHLSLNLFGLSTCSLSQGVQGWLPASGVQVGWMETANPRPWWIVACCYHVVKCGEACIFITPWACWSASSEGCIAVCPLHGRELHQGNALRRMGRRQSYHWSGSLPLNYLSLIISSKSLAVYWWSSIIEALPRAWARFSGARWSWGILSKAVRQPPRESGVSRVAGHPLRIHLLIVGFCGSLGLVEIQHVVYHQ